MKNILLISLVVFGFWFFTKEAKDVTINYFYSGPYYEEINEGLNRWSSDQLHFVRVYDIDNSSLEITHVEPDYIKQKNWTAQYVPRKKTIMLNNKYNNILHGEYLISVITHEAGHFLGLKHNSESNSIMNCRVKEYMKPSFLDRKRAEKKVSILYYRNIVENFLYNDNNHNIGASYN